MTSLPRLMLDTGPLGRIANPRRRPEITAWVLRFRATHQLIVPEIADYEVRREFLQARLDRSRDELDALKAALTYWPISTPAMLRAADLWADARRRGRPTADLKELDGDVILAAQTIEAGATVVTDNIGHLGRFVPILPWSTVAP